MQNDQSELIDRLLSLQPTERQAIHPKYGPVDKYTLSDSDGPSFLPLEFNAIHFSTPCPCCYERKIKIVEMRSKVIKSEFVLTPFAYVAIPNKQTITSFFHFPESNFQTRKTALRQNESEIALFLHDMLQAMSYYAKRFENDWQCNGDIRPERIYYNSVSQSYQLIDKLSLETNPIMFQLRDIEKTEELANHQRFKQKLQDERKRLSEAKLIVEGADGNDNVWNRSVSPRPSTASPFLTPMKSIGNGGEQIRNGSESPSRKRKSSVFGDFPTLFCSPQIYELAKAKQTNAKIDQVKTDAFSIAKVLLHSLLDSATDSDLLFELNDYDVTYQEENFGEFVEKLKKRIGFVSQILSTVVFDWLFQGKFQNSNENSEGAFLVPTALRLLHESGLLNRARGQPSKDPEFIVFRELEKEKPAPFHPLCDVEKIKARIQPEDKIKAEVERKQASERQRLKDIETKAIEAKKAGCAVINGKTDKDLVKDKIESKINAFNNKQRKNKPQISTPLQKQGVQQSNPTPVQTPIPKAPPMYINDKVYLKSWLDRSPFLKFVTVVQSSDFTSPNEENIILIHMSLLDYRLNQVSGDKAQQIKLIDECIELLKEQRVQPLVDEPDNLDINTYKREDIESKSKFLRKKSVVASIKRDNSNAPWNPKSRSYQRLTEQISLLEQCKNHVKSVVSIDELNNSETGPSKQSFNVFDHSPSIQKFLSILPSDFSKESAINFDANQKRTNTGVIEVPVEPGFWALKRPAEDNSPKGDKAANSERKLNDLEEFQREQQSLAQQYGKLKDNMTAGGEKVQPGFQFLKRQQTADETDTAQKIRSQVNPSNVNILQSQKENESGMVGQSKIESGFSFLKRPNEQTSVEPGFQFLKRSSQQKKDEPLRVDMTASSQQQTSVEPGFSYLKRAKDKHIIEPGFAYLKRSVNGHDSNGLSTISLPGQVIRDSCEPDPSLMNSIVSIKQLIESGISRLSLQQIDRNSNKRAPDATQNSTAQSKNLSSGREIECGFTFLTRQKAPQDNKIESGFHYLKRPAQRDNDSTQQISETNSVEIEEGFTFLKRSNQPTIEQSSTKKANEEHVKVHDETNSSHFVEPGYAFIRRPPDMATVEPGFTFLKRQTPLLNDQIEDGFSFLKRPKEQINQGNNQNETIQLKEDKIGRNSVQEGFAFLKRPPTEPSPQDGFAFLKRPKSEHSTEDGFTFLKRPSAEPPAKTSSPHEVPDFKKGIESGYNYLKRPDNTMTSQDVEPGFTCLKRPNIPKQEQEVQTPKTNILSVDRPTFIKKSNLFGKSVDSRFLEEQTIQNPEDASHFVTLPQTSNGAEIEAGYFALKRPTEENISNQKAQNEPGFSFLKRPQQQTISENIQRKEPGFTFLTRPKKSIADKEIEDGFQFLKRPVPIEISDPQNSQQPEPGFQFLVRPKTPQNTISSESKFQVEEGFTFLKRAIDSHFKAQENLHTTTSSDRPKTDQTTSQFPTDSKAILFSGNKTPSFGRPSTIDTFKDSNPADDKIEPSYTFLKRPNPSPITIPSNIRKHKFTSFDFQICQFLLSDNTLLPSKMPPSTIPKVSVPNSQSTANSTIQRFNFSNLKRDNQTFNFTMLKVLHKNYIKSKRLLNDNYSLLFPAKQFNSNEPRNSISQTQSAQDNDLSGISPKYKESIGSSKTPHSVVILNTYSVKTNEVPEEKFTKEQLNKRVLNDKLDSGLIDKRPIDFPQNPKKLEHENSTNSLDNDRNEDADPIMKFNRSDIRNNRKSLKSNKLVGLPDERQSVPLSEHKPLNSGQKVNSNRNLIESTKATHSSNKMIQQQDSGTNLSASGATNKLLSTRQNDQLLMSQTLPFKTDKSPQPPSILKSIFERQSADAQHQKDSGQGEKSQTEVQNFIGATGHRTIFENVVHQGLHLPAGPKTDISNYKSVPKHMTQTASVNEVRKIESNYQPLTKGDIQGSIGVKLAQTQQTQQGNGQQQTRGGTPSFEKTPEQDILPKDYINPANSDSGLKRGSFNQAQTTFRPIQTLGKRDSSMNNLKGQKLTKSNNLELFQTKPVPAYDPGLLNRSGQVKGDGLKTGMFMGGGQQLPSSKAILNSGFISQANKQVSSSNSAFRFVNQKSQPQMQIQPAKGVTDYKVRILTEGNYPKQPEQNSRQGYYDQGNTLSQSGFLLSSTSTASYPSAPKNQSPINSQQPTLSKSQEIRLYRANSPNIISNNPPSNFGLSQPHDPSQSRKP